MRFSTPIILLTVALTACDQETDRPLLQEPVGPTQAEVLEPVREVEGVTCTVGLEKASYTVGEIPKAKVVLHNGSGEELVLPRGLDGSEAGWRYPHCGFEVFDEHKKPIQLGGIARCGNMSTLSKGDFAKLGAGDSLNLSENGYAGYWGLYQISSKPGTYWIRHYYLTSGGPVEDYFGDERMLLELKKDEPDVEFELDPAIVKLAGEIPKVTVYSEMVKLVIEPKAD